MLVGLAPLAGALQRMTQHDGNTQRFEGTTMTDKTMTRRNFVGAAAVAVPVAAMFASREAAAQATLPKLDLNDPVAKALMYVHDAAQVDTAKAPNFKPTQNCANCVQIQAGSGDWRPCTAFPGKLVATKGWCSAWAAKPA
jgi:hypothetical protein